MQLPGKQQVFQLYSLCCIYTGCWYNKCTIFAIVGRVLPTPSKNLLSTSLKKCFYCARKKPQKKKGAIKEKRSYYANIITPQLHFSMRIKLL